MAGDEGELPESGLYQSGLPSPLLPVPLPRMLLLMEDADRQLSTGDPVRGFDDGANRHMAFIRIMQWAVFPGIATVVAAFAFRLGTAFAVTVTTLVSVGTVTFGMAIGKRRHRVGFLVSDEALTTNGFFRQVRTELTSVKQVLVVTHVASKYPVYGLGVRVRGRKRAVRVPGTMLTNSPTQAQGLLLAWAHRHGIPQKTHLVPPPPLPDWARPDPSYWFASTGALVRGASVGEVPAEVGVVFLRDAVTAKREITSVQIISKTSARVTSLPLSARNLRVDDVVHIGPAPDPHVVFEIKSLDTPSERGVVQITMYDRNSILEWRPLIENEQVRAVISPMPTVVRLDVANTEALDQTLRALQPWAKRQAIQVSVVAHPFGRKP